jgi:hypothetical protein
VTRRRQQRDTVPEPFVSMHELAKQWFARLNDSAAAQCPTSDVNGRREAGPNFNTQGE